MRRSRSDRQPTNDYREDNLQKNWDLTVGRRGIVTKRVHPLLALNDPLLFQTLQCVAQGRPVPDPTTTVQLRSFASPDTPQELGSLDFLKPKVRRMM